MVLVSLPHQRSLDDLGEPPTADDSFHHGFLADWLSKRSMSAVSVGAGRLAKIAKIDGFRRLSPRGRPDGYGRTDAPLSKLRPPLHPYGQHAAAGGGSIAGMPPAFPRPAIPSPRSQSPRLRGDGLGGFGADEYADDAGMGSELERFAQLTGLEDQVFRSGLSFQTDSYRDPEGQTANLLACLNSTRGVESVFASRGTLGRAPLGIQSSQGPRPGRQMPERLPQLDLPDPMAQERLRTSPPDERRQAGQRRGGSGRGGGGRGNATARF